LIRFLHPANLNFLLTSKGRCRSWLRFANESATDHSRSASLYLAVRRLRIMRIYRLLAYFLLAFTPFLQAQRWHASTKGQLTPQTPLPLEDMAHMNWVRRDGAPSEVTALAQTTDGYLWIGSRLASFVSMVLSSRPIHSLQLIPNCRPLISQPWPLIRTAVSGLVIAWVA
jgi:hypothetical protein